MRSASVRPWVVSSAAGAALALLAAAALHALAPWPRAEVARGTEEAFVRGLYPREVLPGGGLRRWTTDRVRVAFRNVPAGDSTLEVRLRGHRGPVAVAVDGLWVGSLDASESSRRFPLPARPAGRRDVELSLPVFRAGDGRDLGAMFESVSLEIPASRRPPWMLVTVAVGLALTTALLALACGLGPWLSTGVAAAVAGLQLLLLWPSGLVRSPYAATLSALLWLGVLVAAGFSSWIRRRFIGSGPAAFVSALGAWIVLAVLATSPVMVASDAVFHAHHLERVARGGFFPVSVTQHARPFRFPYGVSFYALLAPLERLGIDAVVLVRAGAALSAFVGSLVLFVLLARTSALASAVGVAILLLQPVSFDVLSHGNFSNVFGQSVTLIFFVWWAGSRQAGGWPLGAGLLTLAALAHFSSFVVLVALCAFLVLVGRRSLGRTRTLALVAGLTLAFLYYGSFARMILEQLPRLLEGAGSGRGAPGPLTVLWRELREAASGWGLPAIALALLGLPRSQERPGRDLMAYWLAGALLAVAALVSPVDVRYMYALAPILAIAACFGFVRLWQRGIPARLLALALIAWQATLGVRNMAEAVYWRYR